MMTISATKPQTQAAPIKSASTAALASWVLFEWATQPFYTLIVTFLFAPYFANVVVGNQAEGQALWGYASAVAGILIAVGSPILGAVADVRGQRKPWMAAFVVVLAAAMAGLWWATPGLKGAPLYGVLAICVVATVAAEFCVVFFNAMMPTLVPREKLGKLSGTGWAVGYVGGLIALAIMAGLVATDPGTGKTLFGLDPIIKLDAAQRQGDRLVGPFSALWLLVFCIPLFLFTPDAPRNSGSGTISGGVKSFMQTVKELPQHPEILRFLVARMLFSDGLSAIFVFGGIYGSGLFSWGLKEQGLFAIIVVIAGAAGAFLGGFLDDKIGSKRVICGALLVVIAGAIGILSVDATRILFSMPVAPKVAGSAAFSSPGELAFLAFAIAIGIVAAPVQASSRSLIARLAPPDKMTQFFGLFAFSGKVTAFAAPLAVALLTNITGSQRLGMAAIVAFLVVGLVLMLGVKTRET
jgi:MFS transporter, UMF1 family